MNTFARPLRPPFPWVWGFSMIIALGFAFMCLEIFAQTGQNVPVSAGPPSAFTALRSAGARTVSMGGARSRCSECGIVESTQEIDAPGAESPGRYAYTVRFRDGSTQMITNAHPVNWRAGQRVIIIAGAD